MKKLFERTSGYSNVHLYCWWSTLLTVCFNAVTVMVIRCSWFKLLLQCRDFSINPVCRHRSWEKVKGGTQKQKPKKHRQTHSATSHPQIIISSKRNHKFKPRVVKHVQNLYMLLESRVCLSELVSSSKQLTGSLRAQKLLQSVQKPF